MDQDLVTGRRESTAARPIRRGMEVRGRDEIRDHLHVAPDAAEGAVRLLLEILGHGGDTVRLLDRELRDREVGRILSHEGDVGAVEGGDDLQVALALEHLLREPRGRRVRDRVVDVHQLELLAQRDLVLLHRERQRVRGLLEQGIVRRHDLVERDALGEFAPQPERARVRDDVDLVAAARQLQAELRRHGPGAAVGRVTGDSDAHRETSDLRRQTSDIRRQTSDVRHQRAPCATEFGSPLQHSRGIPSHRVSIPHRSDV